MSESPQLKRDVLPIPDITPVGLTTYDAKDPATSFPPIEPLRPPAGAPNVLIILLDDVGFAASSAFGGPSARRQPSASPTNGLKYNRFHTTALCSPTRQALLTGRNHHSVGMGGITEIATSAPGYNSIRPNTCAPLAETLKLNGYSTAQFGKCHEVPVWETSPMGPFNAWPTGCGLRALLRLHRRRDESVRAGDLPGHGADRARPHAGGGLPLHRGHDRPRDRLDQAAEVAHAGQALLRLLRPGATHAPHHVRPEWSDKYKGKFDDGWDALARANLRAAEGARRDPAGCGADRASGGDPRLGRHARRPEAGARAPDGGVRRFPRAHGPPRRQARSTRSTTSRSSRTRSSTT